MASDMKEMALFLVGVMDWMFATLPKFLQRNSNTQLSGIWRWGIGSEIGARWGHEGGALTMSIGALIRRDTRVLILHHFPLHHHVKNTERRWLPTSQEKKPHQESDWQASGCWTSASRIISNKFLLFKLLILWYFIMTTQTEKVNGDIF